MSFEHADAVFAFVVVMCGVSLLVTTLTQAVSALLGLRGSNLRWGVRTLLEALDPSLKDHARQISQAVLSHPLLSDSTFSGFRTRLLKRWKLASAIRQDELVEILHLLAQSDASHPNAAGADEWRPVLQQALDRLDRASADRIVLAAPEVKLRFADDPRRAAGELSDLMTSAETLTLGVRRWFDPVMVRASQRFTLHARIWTVVFATAIAFAAHLDAFQLIGRLSSDGELRARLTASADTLARRADALSDATTAPVDPAASAAPLRRAADDIKTMVSDELRLKLVPDPYPSPFYEYWKPSWRHFFGILASAALLSLGAPFWFNVLKTFSSLRPAAADHADRDDKKT